MEIKQYFDPIIKWWWLLAISVILAAGSSYYMVSQQPPVYQSTATILIGRAFEDPNPTGSELYLGEQLARTYANLMRRQPIRQQTMSALGLDSLPPYIAQPVPNSQLLEISVTSTDPLLAQTVANELANQLILQSPTSEGPDDQERQAFVNSQLESLQENIEETEQEIVNKQSELEEAFSARAIADLQDEIRGLQSKLSTLQDNYGRLFSSTQGGATNTLTLIEPASLPRSPVGPAKMQTVISTMAVALALAAGTAYLLEYLDDTVKSPEEVTRVTNLPSLPGIPLLQSKEEPYRVIALEEPLEPSVDAFRAVRTVVQFKARGKSNPQILITSSSPGDGKSFVAANLAVVIAQGGSKVLLVDGDLRRPSQHKLFDLSKRNGFSKLLKNYKPNASTYMLKSLLSDCIEKSSQENLWIMHGNSSNGYESKLMDVALLEEVINMASERYDYVIIDGAPLLATSDSLTISNRVDGVILVANARKTRNKELKQAANQLQMVEANIFGVLLNRVKENDAGYAYKYYGEYMTGKREEQKEPEQQRPENTIFSGLANVKQAEQDS